MASDGKPDMPSRNAPISMLGSFFPEEAKIMKHLFKPPDARPTKRVVFHAS
jgi:hypothetical protein